MRRIEMLKKSINRNKWFLLVSAVILCFVLAACSDQYMASYNPAVDNFNAALHAFNQQQDAYTADNSQFSNPDWQSKTKKALADLDASAKVMAGTDPSNVPSQYANLDAITKQISAAVGQLVATYNQAIDQQDQSASTISKINTEIDTLSSLVGQQSAEIDKVNGTTTP
jgi:type II secretory pathway pseudopilin PulG